MSTRAWCDVGLRKYERERRKYYFAVIECDNKFTANGIYELTDGTEFMVAADAFRHH